MSYEGPDRREHKAPVPQFISMDAAMLRQQTERIDALVEGIGKLAKAIAARPTAEEIAHDKKMSRIRNVAGIVLLATIFTGFGLQQRELDSIVERDRLRTFDACESRNESNRDFLKLLADLAALDPAVGPVDQIFTQYASNLKEVDCQKLLAE